MAFDELIRAFCYFLIFPAYIYFGLITWNRRQFGVALTYFGLAAFFFLLFAGLLLRHYQHPIPVLSTVNTCVVVMLTVITTWRTTSILMTALVSSFSQSVVLKELEHE